DGSSRASKIRTRRSRNLRTSRGRRARVAAPETSGQGLGTGPARELPQLELRKRTELSQQARAERLVVTRRSAPAPHAQPRRDQLTVHVVIERLELGEPLEMLRPALP